MTGDPEIEAMGTLAAVLSSLDPDAQARVLRWAVERFHIPSMDAIRTRVDEQNLTQVGLSEGKEAGEERDGRALQFRHFADLIDAVNPRTDVDRALTGGYWFQELVGQESFVAQQVNNALKDVGQGVTNISRSLIGLQQRTPALVRQLSKSGRSRQARKTYKLTTAGINEIRHRLRQPEEMES